MALRTSPYQVNAGITYVAVSPNVYVHPEDVAEYTSLRQAAQPTYVAPAPLPHPGVPASPIPITSPTQILRQYEAQVPSLPSAPALSPLPPPAPSWKGIAAGATTIGMVGAPISASVRTPVMPTSLGGSLISTPAYKEGVSSWDLMSPKEIEAMRPPTIPKAEWESLGPGAQRAILEGKVEVWTPEKYEIEEKSYAGSVKAFEADKAALLAYWSPYIKGGEFVGSESDYQKYLKESRGLESRYKDLEKKGTALEWQQPHVQSQLAEKSKVPWWEGFVPVYGTVKTFQRQGIKSPWAWLSAAGDVLMFVPMVGWVAKGSVAAKTAGLGGRLGTVGRSGLALGKEIPQALLPVPVMSYSSIRYVAGAGFKPLVKELWGVSTYPVRHPIAATKEFGGVFTGSRQFAPSQAALLRGQVTGGILRTGVIQVPKVKVKQSRIKVGEVVPPQTSVETGLRDFFPMAGKEGLIKVEPGERIFRTTTSPYGGTRYPLQVVGGGFGGEVASVISTAPGSMEFKVGQWKPTSKSFFPGGSLVTEGRTYTAQELVAMTSKGYKFTPAEALKIKERFGLSTKEVGKLVREAQGDPKELYRIAESLGFQEIQHLERVTRPAVAKVKWGGMAKGTWGGGDIALIPGTVIPEGPKYTTRITSVLPPGFKGIKIRGLEEAFRKGFTGQWKGFISPGEGIVLGPKAEPRTLAHELGHLLQGHEFPVRGKVRLPGPGGGSLGEGTYAFGFPYKGLSRDIGNFINREVEAEVRGMHMAGRSTKDILESDYWSVIAGHVLIKFKDKPGVTPGNVAETLNSALKRMVGRGLPKREGFIKALKEDYPAVGVSRRQMFAPKEFPYEAPGPSLPQKEGWSWLRAPRTEIPKGEAYYKQLWGLHQGQPMEKTSQWNIVWQAKKPGTKPSDFGLGGSLGPPPSKPVGPKGSFEDFMAGMRKAGTPPKVEPPIGGPKDYTKGGQWRKIGSGEVLDPSKPVKYTPDGMYVRVEEPPKTPPVKPPAESQAPPRVKVLITKADEIKLRGLGYTQSEIDKMKPEEAGKILDLGVRKPFENIFGGSGLGKFSAGGLKYKFGTLEAPPQVPGMRAGLADPEVAKRTIAIYDPSVGYVPSRPLPKIERGGRPIKVPKLEGLRVGFEALPIFALATTPFKTGSAAPAGAKPKTIPEVAYPSIYPYRPTTITEPGEKEKTKVIPDVWTYAPWKLVPITIAPPITGPGVVTVPFGFPYPGPFPFTDKVPEPTPLPVVPPLPEPVPPPIPVITPIPEPPPPSDIIPTPTSEETPKPPFVPFFPLPLPVWANVGSGGGGGGAYPSVVGPLGVWKFKGMKIYGPHPLKRKVAGGKFLAGTVRYGKKAPRLAYKSVRI